MVTYGLRSGVLYTIEGFIVIFVFAILSVQTLGFEKIQFFIFYSFYGARKLSSHPFFVLCFLGFFPFIFFMD